ncbi:DUF6220 domain-containing protein [Dactylosporangium sp. NPDC051484]|uniref:DUF6220 domain-containing protein n=1 Tax=Dactylosporangium sp. NPDC051484 TaxID=3154942 RepID=UPI00344F3D22
MRKVYLGMSGVVLLAVLAQFYFAAFGAFSIPRDHASFEMHSVNGMIVIPLASLLTTVVAALARAPGRLIGLAAAPFGLVVVQILIFVVVHLVTEMTMEQSTPGAQWILGLHALNGLAVVSVALLGVVRARRFVRAASAETAHATKVVTLTAVESGSRPPAATAPAESSGVTV